MNQLTFVEKISVLFKLLFSSPIIIGIFAFSMILMILLFFYSKLNKKIMKFVFIFIYVALIGFALFKYGKYFLTSIDSFVTLFMANIYFPIIPVYVFIMLISFIIMIITLSSKNNHRIVKIINTIFFTFIQMLFALFVYIVEMNNIDISENSNLYSNEQTMTLLELGMGLFVIWLLVLIIIFYLKKADKIFKVKKKVESDDFDEYINDYNDPSSDNKKKVSEPVVNSKPIDVNMSSDEKMHSLVPEFSDFSNEKSSVSNLNTVSNNSTNNGVFSNVSPIDNGSSSPILDNSVNNVNVQSNNSFINNDSLEKKTNVNPVSSGSSTFDIFNSFEFLNVSPKVERKNDDDDVEIIDFD